MPARTFYRARPIEMATDRGPTRYEALRAVEWKKRLSAADSLPDLISTITVYPGEGEPRWLKAEFLNDEKTAKR